MNALLQKNLISTKEASSLSGYNADYLSRLCREKKIASSQIGRTWLIERASLEAFMEAQVDRKIELAENLARERELEYRNANTPIARASKVTSNLEERMRAAASSVLGALSVVSMPRSMPMLSGRAVAAGLTALVLGASVTLAGTGVVARAGEVALASAFDARSFVIDAALDASFNANNKLAQFVLVSEEEKKEVDAILAHAKDTRIELFPDVVGESLNHAHAPIEVTKVAFEYAEKISSTYPAPLTSRELASRIVHIATHPGETLSAFASEAMLSYNRIGLYVLNDIETILALHMRGIQIAGEGLLSTSSFARDMSVRAPLAIGHTFVRASAAATSLYEDGIYAYAENIEKVPETIVGALYQVGSITGGTVAISLQEAPAAYEKSIVAFAENSATASASIAEGSFAFGKGANSTVMGLLQAQDRAIAASVMDARFAFGNLGDGAINAATAIESIPAVATDKALGLAGGIALRIENTDVSMLSASPLAALDIDRFIPGFLKNVTAILARAAGSAFHGIFGPLAGFFGASEEIGLAVIPGGETSFPGPGEGEGTEEALKGNTTVYNGPVTIIRNEYPTANYGGVPQTYVDERFEFLRRTLYNRIEDVADDRTFRGNINDSTIVDSSITDSSFNGGTITNATISGGSINGSALNVSTTTITGSLTVNGDLSVSGSVSENSTTTNATTTNFYATNGTIDNLLGTNATITNATTTNFYAALATIVDGFFTNLTATLANITTAVIANLTATDATFTNATTTNATSTNLFATNATTTNFFATSAGFTSAVIDALTSPLANITTAIIANLTATDATFTNATTTNATTTGSLALTYATPLRLLSVGATGIASSTNLSSWVAGTLNQLTVTDNGVGGVTLSLPSTIVIGSSQPTTITSDGATSTFGGGIQATFIEGGQYIAGPYVLATSTTATSAFSGNIAVGRDTTLGTTAADLLTVNSSIASNLVPSANNTYDLGSAGSFWRRGYVDELIVNNLSAASSSIAGTVSSTFSINNDNATNDTEDVTLIFDRGLASPNALLTWNSTTDRFEFNMPVFSADGIFTSATTTNLVATNFTLNGETFTDLTGTNLTNTGGALGLSASYAGQSSITTVGTITSGTWNGSTIGVPYGGTGATSLTGLLIGNGTGAFTATTLSSGIAGQISDETGTGSLVFSDSPTFTGTSVFANLTATNATSTNFAATNFTLGGSTFTSLLGAGLSNVGGALTADIAALAGSFFQQGGNSFGATAVLGTNDSNNLAFETAGATRLTLDTSGNVGIGTTTPTSLLDLYKNTDGYTKITVRNPNTGTDALAGIEFVQDIGGIGSLYTTGNAFDGNADFGALPGYANSLWLDASFELTGGLKLVARNGDIGFYAGSRSTQNVTISGTNGNLGVGSTTPSARLSVRGVGTTASTIAFQTTDSANVPGVTITDNGRFMMGTTTSTFPAFFVSTGSQTLVAQRDSSATSLTSSVVSGGAFRNADTTNNNYSSLQFLGVDVSGAGQTFGHIANVMTDHTTSSIDSDFAFILRNNNTLSEAMRIRGTGNVGIGTSAPDYKLDVRGSGNDSTSASIQVRSLAGLGNTNAAALVNVKSADSSGFYGAFPSDYATAAYQDRIALSTNSDAGGLSLIALSAGQDIRFFAGGSSERMRIDSSGNVGIGTTNPSSHKLVVVGGNANTLRIDNAGEQYTALDYYNNGSLRATSYWDNTASQLIHRVVGAGDIGFDTDLTRRMTIQRTTGNVGIGTTAPTGQLHVLKSGTAISDFDANVGVIVEGPSKVTTNSQGNLAVFSNDTAADGIGGSIAFGGKYSGNDAAAFGRIAGVRSNGGSYYGDLTFYTRATDATMPERMRITSAGNVGIGTTTPRGVFDVSAGLNSYAYIGGNAFGHRSVRIGQDSSGYATIQGVDASVVSTVRDLTLQPSGGNVGIGNTSPSYKLTVNGDATTGQVIGIYGADRTWSLVQGGSTSSVGGFGIRDNFNNSTRLAIDASGNVGIGTTAPSELLTVAGNIDTTNGADRSLTLRSSTSYNYRLQTTGDDFQILEASDPAKVRFHIDYPNGNIGIGTTGPTTNLQVGGLNGSDQSFRLGSATNVSLDFNTAGSSGVNTISATNNASGTSLLAFHTSSGGVEGERLRIDASGNVGVGTTVPSSLMHVAGNTGSALNYILEPNGWSGLKHRLGVQYSGDTSVFSNNALLTSATAGTLDNTAQTGSALILGSSGTLNYVQASAGSNPRTFTSALYVNSAGSVGIGTTAPGDKLHVYDANAVVGNPTVRLESFVGGYGAGIEAGSQLTGGSYLAMGKAVWDGEGSWNTTASTQDSYFTVHTVENGTMAEKLRITSAGNVGIGTSNPSSKFSVYQPSGAGRVIADFSNGNRDRMLEVVQDISGDSTSYIGLNSREFGSSLGRDFVLQTAGTERMRVAFSTGNVGIGNTSPTNLLTVGATGDSANTLPTLRIQGQSVSDGVSAYGSYGSFILNSTNGYTASARRFLVTNALNLNTFAIIRSTDGTTDPTLGTAGAIASGTADFVINNAGNVGIGTTGPSQKLHVNGNLLVDSFARGDNSGIFFRDGFTHNVSLTVKDWGSSNVSSDGLLMSGYDGIGLMTSENTYNAANVRLFIQGGGGASAGYVGIGTLAPSVRLDVRTPASAASMTLGAATGVALGVQSGSGSFGWYSGVNNSTGNSWIQAGRTDGNTTAYNLSLQASGGNVGIGDTTPDAKLDILQASDTSAQGFQISRSNDTDYTRLYMSAGVGSLSDTLIFNTSFAGDVAAIGRDGSAYFAGNLSVGTASPADRLTVQVAANKRINVGAVSSSAIADFSTGAAGIQFSRGNDGADNLNSIFTYNDVGNETNLAFAARNDLVFAAGSGSTYQNAPERMRIEANGRVGIGTATPSVSLEVYSGGNTGLQVGGPTTSSPFIQLNEGVVTRAYTQYNYAGGYTEQYSSGAHYFSGGNVGIGVTNPAYKLTVGGSRSFSVDTGNGGTRVQADAGGWAFAHNAIGSSGTNLGGFGYYGGFDSLVRYYIGTFNTDEKMTILSGGNVGIANTNPTGKLDVIGTHSDVTLDANSVAVANFRAAAHVQLAVSMQAAAPYTISLQGKHTTADGFAYPIALNPNGGNVGVGTTNAGYKFTVADGTTEAAGRFNNYRGTGTNYGVYADAVGAGTYSVGGYFQGSGATYNFGVSTTMAQGSGNNWAIYSGGTAQSYFEGSVGVGVQVPTSKLDVAGGNIQIDHDRTITTNQADTFSYDSKTMTQYGLGWWGDSWNGAGNTAWLSGYSGVKLFTGATMRMSVDISGNVAVTNLASCGGIQTNGSGVMSCTSDERLKDTQGAFATGLSGLRGITPQTYTWKNGTDYYDGGVPYSGFIAQNVGANIPEAMGEGANGFKQINTTTILAASVNAIKELDIRTLALAPAAENQAAHSLAVSSDASVAGMLTVTGIGTFSDSLTAASVFTEGSMTAVAFLTATNGTLPEEVLTGGSADLFKMASYAITNVQALSERTDLLATRIDEIDARLAIVEAGSTAEQVSGAVGFTVATLKTALQTLGIYLENGIAQFETLVFRQLAVAKDTNGDSSAGSQSILAGNTVTEVQNPYVLPTSKIFVTFTGPIQGAWYISNKEAGKFRVTLAEGQSADVSFDYFILQTEGQLASPGAAGPTPTQNVPTPTPSNDPLPPVFPGDGTTVVGGNGDTTPPQIALVGPAAREIAVGATWIDQGATATDETDGDLTSAIQVTGTVDTNTPGLYTISYSVSDAGGNEAHVSRIVTVEAASTPAPAPAPTPTPTPTPEPEPAPAPAPEPPPAPAPEPPPAPAA